MNIALGAVFIFILLIPPIAFYVSYSFGRFAKAGPKFSLLDGILASAIFSLFIHTVGILVIGGDIRFDILLKLVGGELKDVESKISNHDFTNALKQFSLYNVIVFVTAIALGRVVRTIVERSDIHFQNELLRLNNKWWYLINGYYLTEIGWERREFDMLFVDAVVDTSAGSIIYSGYLVEFVCNGEDLDRIYLNDAIRRELKRKVKDNNGNEAVINQPGDAASIPGEFFCIAYRDIKNLNLRFINLDNTVEEIEQLPDDFSLEDEVADADIDRERAQE
jgi:hypothetical protein